MIRGAIHIEPESSEDNMAWYGGALGGRDPERGLWHYCWGAIAWAVRGQTEPFSRVILHPNDAREP